MKAKVRGEVKGDKIDIFKYKNKTGYSRRQGHRQRYNRARDPEHHQASGDQEEAG